ncbi:MAG: flagellar biosynthetic protein FliO [Deltaproteobacteria bacterium]|nr:flagellar biosynthetic protein FliO [Deltaproteobacteria bacterium]
MRKTFWIVALLAPCVVSTEALAQQAELIPRLKVIQDEASVTINVTVTPDERPRNAQAEARSDRVEIPLPGLQIVGEVMPLDDDLVKRIELIPGPNARLSIKTRRGREGTAKTAAGTSVAVTSQGIRVVLPRERNPVAIGQAVNVGAAQGATVAPQAPAPTVPVGIVVENRIPSLVTQAQGAGSNSAGTNNTLAPAAVVATTAAEVAAKQEAKAVEPAVPTITTPAAAPATPAVPAEKPSFLPALNVQGEMGTINATPKPNAARASIGGSSVAWGILLLLACCGIGFLARRRIKIPNLGESIRVISSQALGPRTRLVLVAAGSRKLLLSVGDKGTHVLAKWSRRAEDEGPEGPSEKEMPLDHEQAQPSRLKPLWKQIMAEEESDAGPAQQPARGSSESPLVSGILRLRTKARAAEPQDMSRANGAG